MTLLHAPTLSLVPILLMKNVVLATAFVQNVQLNQMNAVYVKDLSLRIKKISALLPANAPMMNGKKRRKV